MAATKVYRIIYHHDFLPCAHFTLLWACPMHALCSSVIWTITPTPSFIPMQVRWGHSSHTSQTAHLFFFLLLLSAGTKTYNYFVAALLPIVHIDSLNPLAFIPLSTPSPPFQQSLHRSLHRPFHQPPHRPYHRAFRKSPRRSSHQSLPRPLRQLLHRSFYRSSPSHFDHLFYSWNPETSHSQHRCLKSHFLPLFVGISALLPLNQGRNHAYCVNSLRSLAWRSVWLFHCNLFMYMYSCIFLYIWVLALCSCTLVAGLSHACTLQWRHMGRGRSGSQLASYIKEVPTTESKRRNSK